MLASYNTKTNPASLRTYLKTKKLLKGREIELLFLDFKEKGFSSETSSIFQFSSCYSLSWSSLSKLINKK